MEKKLNSGNINDVIGLLDYLEKNEWNVQLFFITRELKENVKPRDKVIDKYKFNAHKADLDNEISEYFKELFLKNIITATKKENLMIKQYEVISDDISGEIYTYALNNSLSFSDVITNQIPNETFKELENLDEIDSEMWAYILKIEYNNKIAYSFRKMGNKKITRTYDKGAKEKISSFFDTKDLILRNVKEEQISFDDKIDCIYLDNNFYIFRKKSFETLVGLEEELKENAKDILSTLRNSNLISGLDLMEDETNKSKRLLSQLASIAKKGLIEKFNKDEILKMRDVLKQMEDKELKLTNEGKIKLEDLDDLNTFIKLLNDYYKQGLVSGKYYGTNSGSILKK